MTVPIGLAPRGIDPRPMERCRKAADARVSALNCAVAWELRLMLTPGWWALVALGELDQDA